MHPVVRGLVALVAIFGAARAVAAERTPVVVVPFPALFEEARASVGERIAVQLQDELGRSSRLSAARLPADADGAARAAQALDEARRTFAEAQRLVATNAAAWSDPEDAAGGHALDEAIAQLEANVLGAESLAPLAQALVVKARRQLAGGRAEQARETLREAIALAPEEEFGLSGAAEDLQAEVRAELLAGPRGQVRVETTPPGATVTFDGRVLGETPLLLVDVLPCEHHVRVEKAGIAAARTIRVVTGTETAARFALGGLQSPEVLAVGRALGVNVLDEAALGTARSLGRASGAQLVVVGAVAKVSSGFQVHARVIRVSDGAIAGLPVVAFDEELLGLDTDVYTLASAVEKALPALTPPKRLPLELHEGAVPRGGERAEVAAVTPPRKAGAGAESVSEEVGGTRRAAGPVASALAAEDAVRGDGGKPSGGSRVWLWTTLGVVTAAAAGTGLYFALQPAPPDRVLLMVTW